MASAGSLLTYYAYRDSPIHRLDPRVKAVWVLAGLIFIFSTDDWRLLLALLLLNLALAVVARLEFSALKPLLQALVFFGAVILVFQVLFRPGEAFAALGPIRLHTAGLYVTREVWFRLGNLALLFMEYLAWTHPTDITLMLVRLGLRYRYAMMLGLALRFFPVLQEEMQQVQEAQQVRGQALNRTWHRIRGIVAVVLPLILRVLKRTNEIALAMELRGFGYESERTYLREIRMKRQDWALLSLLLALVLVQIVLISQRLLVFQH